jgi:hypothetical protein
MRWSLLCVTLLLCGAALAKPRRLAPLSRTTEIHTLLCTAMHAPLRTEMHTPLRTAIHNRTYPAVGRGQGDIDVMMRSMLLRRPPT